MRRVRCQPSVCESNIAGRAGAGRRTAPWHGAGTAGVTPFPKCDKTRPASRPPGTHVRGLAVLALLSALPAASVAGSPVTSNATAEAQRSATGILLDGTRFSGEPRAISDLGEVVFTGPQGERRWTWDALVVWGQYADSDRGTHVLLADGSLLVADVLDLNPESVEVEGRLWRRTRLPREQVRAIVFQPPVDTLRRDQLLLRAGNHTGPEDRVLLDNGDELPGQLAASPATDSASPLRFEVLWHTAGQTEPLNIPGHRVAAILFAARPTPPLPPATHLLIGWSDGSRLVGQQLARNGQQLSIRLAAGPSVATEPATVLGRDPWEFVSMLQPLHARVTYLSDLTAVGYRHTPFLGGSWSYQPDRSVAGGQLRWGNQVCAKGIGMHSSGRLVYSVPAGSRWFDAELAIDARARQHGSVVFRVFTQTEAEGWSEAYASPVVRGGDPPLPIRVSVQQATFLALVVDFGELGDQWDHANWLNARLLR